MKSVLTRIETHPLLRIKNHFRSYLNSVRQNRRQPLNFSRAAVDKKSAVDSRAKFFFQYFLARVKNY
jgi:hypothetical protein